MKSFKNHLVQTKVVDLITCNKCSKVIEYEEEEHLDVEAYWGYYSRWDGFVHDFDLCMACYEHMINSFITPVTVRKAEEMCDHGENNEN